MKEKYILTKGWEKSSWVKNSFTRYIHKKFNYENDHFFIEMEIHSNGYVEIYEEEGNNSETLFRGYLKSNKDLDDIMRLLEFDFSIT